MRKLSSILLFLFFCFVLMAGCSSRKDETKEKAIFNYILYCGPGGTIDSCNAACGATYGTNATNANLQALTSCTSACTTNCNVLGLYLQLSNLNR
ncbi:Putative lipoprotein [Leptospira santarosai]|uniref:Lipoprotein n=1 Tax=Leptospira santarosai TaxID=28183 RepID=A0A2P1QU87_9LEPT|nr:Putative lipoprotein [Leptospira santarosai]